MNGATVFRILDLIPERVTRAQSGTSMGDVGATSCTIDAAAR